MEMSPAAQPVLLEVLAHLPTDFFHCMHCEKFFNIAGIGASVHQEVQTSYPPTLQEEARRLAVWLRDVSAHYGERLHIRIVDPQSLEGFLKSLRYWVREYPTFVVNRHAKYTGWEAATLDRLLEMHMNPSRVPEHREQ
jgi:hypothetical protein